MNNLFIRFLNCLSYLSSFLIPFCIIFMIQNYTFGLVEPFNTLRCGPFYLKDIFFLLTSYYIVHKYVVIITPYKKHLSQ